MEKFLDPTLLPFYLAALVWIYRARLALRSLRVMPVVKPSRHCEARRAEVMTLPLVSVIIPAKNEEKNIGECAESILRQDYPHFEVIVVDDRSTDKTASILHQIASATPGALPRNDNKADEAISELKIVTVQNLPSGWVGKTHAVHTGVQHAKGRWLLFTDADTRHEPGALTAVMEHALSRDLKFLTLLPRCLTGSLVENVIQPTAMTLLGLWFPIEKINDPKSKTYFANGQYLLIERKLYDKIDGHASVRGEFLEDFALMKNSKEVGARVECALGTEVYGTRMYDSFAAIWRGWRRIYLHAFRQNALTLFLKSTSVILFSVVPFVAFASLTISLVQNQERYAFAWAVAVPILLLILSTSWKAYGIVKAKRVFALLHPLAALVTAMILLDAAWMAATKQPTQWR